MYQMIRVMRRHWKPVVALNGLIMVVAIVGILSVKKTWTARAQLILPNATTDLNASLGTLGNVKGGEGLVFTQQVDTREILSKILLSNKTLSSVLERDPEKVDYSDVAAFRDLFSVKPSATSTTIALAVEAPTAQLSEQRLMRLIESFQTQLDALRQDDTSQRSRFLHDELLKAEAALRAAERQLLAFQQAANLADSDTQTAELVRTLSSLNATQIQLNAQLSAAQARAAELSAQLGQSPDQALQALRLQANSVYQANRRRLAELETSLSQNRIRLTDDHPLIVSLLEEQERLLDQQAAVEVPLGETGSLGLDAVVNNNPVAQLSQQLVTVQSDVVSLQSQSEALQQQIAQLTTELSRMPGVQRRLRALQRQYNIAEGAYNGLVARIEATKADTFSAYPSVQVLDAPLVDAKPSGPGRRVVAMGAVLTALLGSAAIVLFRENQNPLLSPDDLHSLGMPILGEIPNFQPRLPVSSFWQRQGMAPMVVNPTASDWIRHSSAQSIATTGSSTSGFGQDVAQDRSQDTVMHTLPHQEFVHNGKGGGRTISARSQDVPARYGAVSPGTLMDMANAEFRRSASALSRMSLSRGRLLISSPSPQEGKTTIAIGLALALSGLGFRVLLVDADLRNRGLSRQLGCDVGSTDKQPQRLVPVQVASRLDVLPLAMEATSWGQFLAQDGFQKILDTLQDNGCYDYVLIDMAPISLNSELSLLLAVVPYVLLVLWQGRSLRKPLAESLNRLQQDGATVPGLILNGVEYGAGGGHILQSRSLGVDGV